MRSRGNGNGEEGTLPKNHFKDSKSRMYWQIKLTGADKGVGRVKDEYGFQPQVLENDSTLVQLYPEDGFAYSSSSPF